MSFHTRRSSSPLIAAIAGILLGVSPAAVDAGDPPDAPLEGFGASTPGGSGGVSIVVTSLADTGPGTLREALAGDGRFITFAVAGTLHVSSPLRLRSFITVDAGSAPAPGITIAPTPGHTGTLIELDGDAFGAGNTHDIILRHLRLIDSVNDNLRLEQGAFNVVVDHCSFRRAADGNIDISSGCSNVTVQWCILGANHKNSLIRTSSTNLSFHHNLFVHGDERNPQVQDSSGPIDFVNNVIYDWDPTVDDWMGDPGYGTRIRTKSSGNLVKNVYIASPRSDPTLAVILDGTTAVYTESNELPDGADDTPTRPTRWMAPAVTELSVFDARTRVLAEAGAYPRDAEDAAYVDAVVAGTVPVGDEGVVLPPVPPGSLPLLRVLGASPGGGIVSLGFSLPDAGRVRVDVFDIGGRHVVRLLDGPRSRGRGDARWDGTTAIGSEAPSGVYIARLTWRGDRSAEARVVLLR